jgi:hypothetical protein
MRIASTAQRRNSPGKRIYGNARQKNARMTQGQPGLEAFLL